MRTRTAPFDGGSRLMTRTLGAAAALYALFLVSVWSMQNRTDASAVEPQAAATPMSARPGDRSAMWSATVLRSAAGRRVAMAQYRLAKLYETGEGVAADGARARYWTERAAVGGNVRAMHDLGVYFARGDGAAADDSAAFRWFRQAADFDVADSQYNLGVLYLQGRGVSENAAEALFWFMLAARHGDETAAARVAALETRLTPMHAEQARARAAVFRPRTPNAAANGMVR